MTTAKNSEVFPLTSLRFFLASWIVWFHLEVSGTSKLIHPGTVPFNILRCAYVAVGIFFLLSGFILALNYPLDRTWNAAMKWKFGIARFSRIYPVYLLGLVGIAPAVVGAALRDHSLLLRRIFSGAMNLGLLQAWIPHAALTWNGPGWSLSDETFFYVCFPVIGAFFFRETSIGKSSGLLAKLWVVALAVPAVTVLFHVKGFGDVAAVSLPDSDFSAFVKYNPLLNLAQFLAGIVTCRIYLRIRQLHPRFMGRGYLFYVPSFMLLFALTASASHIPYPLMHNGLVMPAAIGIVLGLALGDRFLCAVFSNRVLVFLGKASYAEYLLHLPVRVLFEHFGTVWTPRWELIYFACVLAVSGVVFHFYEERLQRILRRWLTPMLVKPEGPAIPV